MELVEKLKPSSKALRDDEYTSSEIQNEILEYFTDAVCKVILSEIRCNVFLMSSDEICNRNNQSIFALVYRTTNDLLDTKELFAGIYIVINKKANTLVETIMVSLKSNEKYRNLL